jgi:perosamine synthetase
LNETASQTQSALPVVPGTEFIPLIVPEIRGHEWDYVKECLDTNWVSSVGAYVERFEKMVAERVGAKYAVATMNGTSALHIALLLAGVQPEDEVLTSALTFIAPANTIRYVGAWPIFIDAEQVNWQIDPSAVANFLEHQCEWDGETLRNRRTNRRVRAILPVHILGHPADINPILELAAKYSLPVIEDATEALGSRYHGRSPGSLAHAGCFSFNGNKIITTGGGGMLVTDDPEWAVHAKYLSTQAKDDPVEYIHDAIGYNYRMTNLLAAMGCAQMEQLDAFIEAKRQIARRYVDSLAHVSGIRFPEESSWAFSTSWMFTILIDENVVSMSSRDLLRELSARSIQTRPLWQPMHQSRAHNPIGSPPCPNAEVLYRQALSLPCSVGLTWSQQRRVIDSILEILKR